MAIISIPTSIGGINIPGSIIGEVSGPLKDLYKGKNLPITKYPRDLDSASKSHAVSFTISEYKDYTLKDISNGIRNSSLYGQSVEQTVDNAINNVGQAKTTIISSAGAVIDSSIEAGKKILSNPLETAATVLETGASKLAGGINEVKNFIQPETKAKEMIFLYMPETMNFTQSAQYDDSVTLASAAGSIPKLGAIASMVTGALDNQAARLVLNKFGHVFNPQQQLLFQGITFRTFQMSFTFTPYSRQEAEDIKKIVNKFRSYSMPTILEQEAGMFFKPPAVFDIKFHFNGAENLNIPKLKTCVVTNVDVNYAPNGWATHTDGAPVQTTMTIDLQEMVLVDSKAVSEGY